MYHAIYGLHATFLNPSKSYIPVLETTLYSREPFLTMNDSISHLLHADVCVGARVYILALLRTNLVAQSVYVCDTYNDEHPNLVMHFSPSVEISIS